MARDNPCEPRRVLPDADKAAGYESSGCCDCGCDDARSNPRSLVSLSVAASAAAIPAACLTLVELTSGFAIGTTEGVDDDAPSAMANVVTYRRSDNNYEASAEYPEITVYHSLVRRDGSGDPAGPAPLASGERGWAYFNAQSGRWELVGGNQSVWRFELTTDLAAGGSATAELVAWNGTTWAANGATFTVYDAQSMFDAATGAKGVAIWHADSGRWEVVQLDACCCGGESTCIIVVTDVSKSGTNLIISRKQICLPPCATMTDLIDLTIEDCCCEEGEPTTP